MAGARSTATSTSSRSVIPQKRVVPADKTNYDRAKRRSSRACLSCRSRKVRCDVITGGMPCTNCRLDSVDCVLTESTRGRKPANASALKSRIMVSAPATRTELPPAQQATPPQNEQANDYIMSLTFDEQSRSQSVDDGEENESHDGQSRFSMHDGISSNQNQAQHPLRPFGNPLEAGAVNAFRPSGTRRSHGSVRQNSIKSNNAFSVHELPSTITPLPLYIKPLPRHLQQRDIDYLTEKDALTIPDDEFRDELLRTYIKIIHIFMPAIDLDKLLAPIINPDGSSTISILLFQAVMFASVIFVDSEMLRARGFESRKHARKTIFKRVRLLYGLDCEPDRLTLIQALLLMTYWYDSPEDEKDTWYWMGITLSLSQVLGLHRDPETLHVSPQEKRLRRRIWWSCYIRDRLLALGIRRPARIRTEDFDVNMLSVDDYDIAQPTPELVAFVRASGFTGADTEKRQVMCQICVELAKLCVCIGDILYSQYSVVGLRAYSSEHYKNIVVMPKESEQQLVELGKCDAQLEQWQREQEMSCRYNPPSPASATATANDKVEDWTDKIAWLHQALLRMIYLTAVGALHRPHALSSTPRDIRTPEPDQNISRQASLSKVKEAAAAVSMLAFDLQSENYLRYLSTSSIPAFLSATMIHLLDVRHSKEGVRNLAIGRFYQCFHVLFELQDMYSSADYAIRFLASVLKRMNVSLPMLAMFQACAAMMTENASRANATNSRAEPTVSSYEQYSVPPSAEPESLPSTSNIATNMPGPIGSTPVNAAMRNIENNQFLSLKFGLDDIPALQSTGNDVSFDATIQPIDDVFLDSTLGSHTWDGLLPALMDFEADPMLGALNVDITTPNRPWRPYCA